MKGVQNLEDARMHKLLISRDEAALKLITEKYDADLTAIARSYSSENAMPPACPADLRAVLGNITRNLAINMLEKNRWRSAVGSGGVTVELNECTTSNETAQSELMLREIEKMISAIIELQHPSGGICQCGWEVVKSIF